MRYHPHTEADIAQMLKAVGAPSLEALFTSIPKELQLKRPLNLPPAMDERTLLDHLGALAARNSSRPPFLGAGAYPHHVPVAVDQLLLRGELYTAYTPYQPEVAQGTLQSIFEYQTFVCQLTGLDVSNASMYDGATAAAEAALMSMRVKGDRRAVVVSRALHPEYRKVIKTFLAGLKGELREVGFGPDGLTDLKELTRAVDSSCAGVVVGYPNFFGGVEKLKQISEIAHAAGALAISATTEPVAFGLLAPPGQLGIDVAVGELQSFGNGMSYGGPSGGFFAIREPLLRQMPGRVCGMTVDGEGRRGFVLTLVTREQHIRREKATSNICTNCGLNALASTIHLALLGQNGLRALALLNYRRAHYARKALLAAGCESTFTGPTFNEFAVKVKDPAKARERMGRAQIDGGFELGREYPELKGSLLFCVTELHSKAAIDELAAAVKG